MDILIETRTPVFLNEDEAKLFVEFQKRYALIGNIVGLLETAGLSQLKDATVVFEFDKTGRVTHSAITKHYRP